MSLLKRYVLEFAVFVCGALVMTFEIIGSRVVSPFIGTSTYVWTSLIGVILASLSLGYWLGGKAADRKPDVRLLGLAILIAGGLVSLTILLKDVVLTIIAEMPAGLEIKSVFASLLLFAPASVALGFVTPYAVKLRIQSLSESGETVGRLYALSTVGSIVGTFAAGFLFIPFVGSTRTLYLIAGSLFILSLLLAPFAFRRWAISGIVIFALGVAANELTAYQLRAASGLHDIDTEYSRVQVFDSTDPKTGRPIRAMAIDPYFLQSAVYLDGGHDLVFSYTPYYDLVRHFRPDFERVLMIGGAGYTVPQEYLREYPSATMDVVEIDPRMTEIARRFFGLRDDPRLNIHHEDGRVFLNNAPPAAYDAVFMDAFGSMFSVPYQLTTLEAVRQVHRVLDDKGVVIFNLGGALTGPAGRFAHAEIATYRTVFARVQIFKAVPERPDGETQNLIVVACKTDCPASPGVPDQQIARLLSTVYSAEIATDQPVLTDDLAPVEYYNSFGQSTYRR